MAKMFFEMRPSAFWGNFLNKNTNGNAYHTYLTYNDTLGQITIDQGELLKSACYITILQIA